MNDYWVAVVGAGPAGIFAARELALKNVNVVLINRDIKPGGLAEYGIFPDKYNMKEGLRVQFRKALALPNLHYYGNVSVGRNGDLSLDDLRALGFHAILVTVGAQGTTWLGLPGEQLDGVYHAKDLVYHYNKLPPFSQRKFHIGRRVAIIGAGNVSLDIVHYLATLPQVEQAIGVIRRGPAEVKFEHKELQLVICALDRDDMETELQRVTPLMTALGQDPDQYRNFINQTFAKAAPFSCKLRFLLRFLLSPTRILDDGRGRVRGLEVENNTLVQAGEEVKARGLGTKSFLDVDTVIFAIGDRVDENLGLAVESNAFVKNRSPRFPIDGVSYEAFDPVAQNPIADIFVAGWAREASKGLVGIARRDGTTAAQAVLQYLNTIQPGECPSLEHFEERITSRGCFPMTCNEWAKLEAVEHQKAQQMGVEEFKFSTNPEMIKAIKEM